MVTFTLGSIVYRRSNVSSRVRSVGDPQPATAGNKAANITRMLCRLVVADRTHKFHHRMCVADQGKKCRERENRPKRCFTPEIVAGFIFHIVACDIPKRACTSAHITCTRLLESEGIVIVICDRQASASGIVTVE